RLDWTAAEVTRHLERFDLGEGARTLYEFVWSELCDWYIELIKPRLYGRHGEESRRAAQHVLWHVLETTLRLLHPYMPFISEEIWQHLHRTTGTPLPEPSVMVAPWPQPAGWRDAAVEQEMNVLIEIVRGIRNVRAEKQVEPGRQITAILQAPAQRRRMLEDAVPYIQSLARVGQIDFIDEGAPAPEQAVAVIAGGVQVHLPLAGLVDIEQEVSRLEKELAETAQQLAAVNARLANESFVAKAPAHVVERERQRQRDLAERERLLRQRLAELRP